MEKEVKEGGSSNNKDEKEAEKHFPRSEKDEMSRPKTAAAGSSLPDHTCAICLQHFQNTAFTDGCLHMFCFTCLVEWSKIKHECPLCKRKFKYIFANVRSSKKHDQSNDNKNKIAGNFSSVRYGTTSTPERLLENRNSDRIESEMNSHRMQYAPHSVNTVGMEALLQSMRQIPCSFRRRIYENNLWSICEPSSEISPDYFKQNIACAHRLLPWLNRELLAVMPTNESQVSFLIELIMALIVKYDVTSEEFHMHIEPYTNLHTSHFIHEFYNFAVSPYETMEMYDRHVQYSMSSESPPDSDFIPSAVNGTISQKSTSTESEKKKHVKEPKNAASDSLKKSHPSSKLLLFRKSGTHWSCAGLYQTVVVRRGKMVPVVVHFGEGSMSPNASKITAYLQISAETPNRRIHETKKVCPGVREEDECQVINVVEVRRARTPVMIDLSNDDDTQNAVNRSSIIEGNGGHSSVETCSKYIFPKSNATVENDSDDDIIFVSETKANKNAVEKPIDYSMDTSGNEVVESASKSQKKESCPSSSRVNTENEISNDTPSSSWPSVSRPKKRRASCLDDNSTESSENAQVSE